MSDMSALLGIQVFKELPKPEKVGAIFWHDGEKYYVTQTEMDRIKNLPTADEIRKKVAAIEALMSGWDMR